MSAFQGLKCPGQDSQLGNCHCQNQSLRAKLELFCPSFQPEMQKLHILVEPEKFVHLNCSNRVSLLDVVAYIEHLQLGDITTFKMINCPVREHSFAYMLSMMGVRNSSKVKEVIINQVQRSSQRLEGYHFANLTNLDALKLQAANIKKVDKKFFEHLPGLKTLDLTDNRGIEIDPDSFHGLKELQLFQCHNCYISDLPEELFRGLDKLRRISLHDNKIQKLLPPIFNGLTSLEELKLTRNHLQDIPRGLFRRNNRLREIDLSHNKIHTWSDSSSVFGNLIKLNLAHNKLTDIPYNFRLNFLSLKLLNMSHNLLGSRNRKLPIDDLKFLQTTDLTVDLAFNQIEQVDLWEERFLEGTDLQGVSLNLTGNPLKCDCWTKELKMKVA